MDWPKTSAGGTDWEAVFEHPDTGLIPHVAQADTPGKLHAVAMLIVEQLFLSDDDTGYRDAYRKQVSRICAPDARAEVDELMPPVVDFLRTIKRERIARSGPHRNGDSRSRDRRGAEIASSDEDDTSWATDDEPTENIFTDVFRDYVRARFDVLTQGLDESLLAAGRLPFILSNDFADRFMACLDRHFCPRLVQTQRGLLMRAENQPPDARRAYLETQMNDQKFRPVFIQTWAELWKELTQPRKLPPRPEEKKQGLLTKLFDKKGGAAPKVYGMTAKDWDKAAAANDRAEQIWAEIVEDTGAYLCPIDDDNRLLMNMLGRTPGGLQKQIAAISQILVQGGSRAAFESYQSGRDIDLALLVASYRHPDSMLGADGFTMTMLGSQPASFRRERFPLVDRYVFGTKALATAR